MHARRSALEASLRGGAESPELHRVLIEHEKSAGVQSPHSRGHSRAGLPGTGGIHKSVPEVTGLRSTARYASCAALSVRYGSMISRKWGGLAGWLAAADEEKHRRQAASSVERGCYEPLDAIP